MSVEFLKEIRKVERDCEEKIKKAETAKDSAVMDAEKNSVLQVRNAEILAKEEAESILSCIQDRIKDEFATMDKEFKEEKNKLDEKAKKTEKKAVEVIFSEVL